MMKLTFISDTHGLHKNITHDLPGGDILIHSGDFSNYGSKEDIKVFLNWFNSLQNYTYKIFIAGNHDRSFEENPNFKNSILKKFPYLTYLEDSEYNIEKVKIYGSPWQPAFCNWAFNLPRNGEELEKKWDLIPENLDILITHGAPFGYLDGTQNIGVGCELLRKRIDQIRPKIHIFGHIHGGYGYYFNGKTHFFNASVLDEKYYYNNLPLNIEWDNVTNELNFY